MTFKRTFLPSGVRTPGVAFIQVVDYLALRAGCDVRGPYRNPADPRHELAVLLVDAGRRLLHLNAEAAKAAEEAARKAERLREYAARRQAALAVSDREVLRPGLSAGRAVAVDALVERIAEAELMMTTLAKAYRSAWRNPGLRAEGKGASRAE